MGAKLSVETSEGVLGRIGRVDRRIIGECPPNAVAAGGHVVRPRKWKTNDLAPSD
jgi:hypothetical protein